MSIVEGGIGELQSIADVDRHRHSALDGRGAVNFRAVAVQLGLTLVRPAGPVVDDQTVTKITIDVQHISVIGHGLYRRAVQHQGIGVSTAQVNLFDVRDASGRVWQSEVASTGPHQQGVVTSTAVDGCVALDGVSTCRYAHVGVVKVVVNPGHVPDQGVVAITAQQGVVLCTADQGVVACSTDQTVVTRSTDQTVVAAATVQGVVTIAALQGVVARKTP